MRDFDQRWQDLAQQARRAPDEEVPAVPFGMVTRVMARLREQPPETWEDVFHRLGLRAVWAALALFVVSAGLAYSEWSSPSLELPQVGVNLGSDLFWP